MTQFYPGRSAKREMLEYPLRILGTGAASPTKQEGQGMTVTWISTGLYEVAFTGDSPFQFVGWTGPGWIATTPGDLKGYTAVCGDYNTTTKKIRVSIYNSSFALADLAATQRMSTTFKFARTGSTGAT
jgi:hypothetical protein